LGKKQEKQISEFQQKNIGPAENKKAMTKMILPWLFGKLGRK
jgi:hypothetical protein